MREIFSSTDLNGVESLPSDICPSDHLLIQMDAEILEEQRLCYTSSSNNCCKQRPAITQSFFHQVYA